MDAKKFFVKNEKKGLTNQVFGGIIAKHSKKPGVSPAYKKPLKSELFEKKNLTKCSGCGKITFTALVKEASVKRTLKIKQR